MPNNTAEGLAKDFRDLVEFVEGILGKGTLKPLPPR